MKRSPSTVTLGAVAGVLGAALSGCSLVGGTSPDDSQAVPTAADRPTATPSGTSSAAAAVAPSATPTGSVAAPMPPSVPGYSLTTSNTSPVQRKFQTVVAQSDGVFTGLTTRTVVKGKQQVGNVVLLGLHPGLVGNTRVERRLVPGIVKGMSGQGATVTQREIDSQSVVVATTRGTNIVAWYRAGTVVLVLGNGTDPGSSLAYAKVYLAAS